MTRIHTAGGGDLHGTSTAPPARVGRSVGVVALCTIVAGLLVNAYLAVVARNLTPAEYSYFGAYWSLSLVLGFGAFLPIEQELARRLQTPADRLGTVRGASVVAAGVALVELALVMLAAPLLWAAIGGRAGTLAALAALCLVSAVQFVVRGSLIGSNQLERHGALLVGDAAVRVALAALVAATVTADSAGYAWTLVAAIAAVHVPALVGLVRRHERDLNRTGGVPPAAVARAVGPLLLGSLCAQLLLNGIPVLAAAVATPAEQAAAGRFLAAFALVRIPLFVAVPLQTSVLPAFTRLVASDRSALLLRQLRRLVLALIAAGAVGAAVAYVAGPWLVGVVFGPRYLLPGGDLALLTLGVAAHLGLLVATQGLVASGLRDDVARSWMSGLAVTGLVFTAVPDLLLRAELAFLLGSTAGWAVAARQLVRRREEAAGVG